MIKLRPRPYYFRMALKVHIEGDFEILNHEYERDLGPTSEDGFISDEIWESKNNYESGEVLVLILRNRKPNAPDCDEE